MPAARRRYPLAARPRLRKTSRPVRLAPPAAWPIQFSRCNCFFLFRAETQSTAPPPPAPHASAPRKRPPASPPPASTGTGGTCSARWPWPVRRPVLRYPRSPPPPRGSPSTCRNSRQHVSAEKTQNVHKLRAHVIIGARSLEISSRSYRSWSPSMRMYSRT